MTFVTIFGPPAWASSLFELYRSLGPEQHLIQDAVGQFHARNALAVDDPDGDAVGVTVAIRDRATFALAIPAEKFHAFVLLELIDRHDASKGIFCGRSKQQLN